MRNLLILLIIIFFILLSIDSIESIKLLFGRPIDRYGFLGLPSKNNEPIKNEVYEKWFEQQKLDHFDPTNTRTWRQRYFINTNQSNFSKNSPIFLQIGGEGEANPVWLKQGQIATNYAKHYNAIQILIEHRYYGQSRPTQNMSTENLKYLTSEQALQDIANFIEFINKRYNNLNGNNKWIVFGGSYSGSLAAWFRMKYPHLVTGAIASSAPVQAILDFTQYLKVVDESLGNECVQQIMHATEELSKLMKSKEMWPEIFQKFALCTPFDGSNPMDVANFFANLAGNFEGVVQYNKDNREFEGISGTNITIDTICSIMTKDSKKKKPLDKFADVNELILNATKQECLEFKYNDYLKKMMITDFDRQELPSARQWTYQTCSEFGFFQTSDQLDNNQTINYNQPFGNYFPIEFFIQQCLDIFGKEFNRKFIENSINFTNINYGGYNLTVTNVLFINGRIDPWHTLSILNDLNHSTKSYLLNETAHCADLYPDSLHDPESLKMIRKIILKTIGLFINQ